MLVYTIRLLFLTYTILLFTRIIASWFPSSQNWNFMRFVNYYTNPYLNVFRKILPPIGGRLDLSPLIAFLVLRFAEKMLLSFLR